MFHKKWFHKGIVIFMVVITCLNSISPVIPAAAYAEQQAEKDTAASYVNLTGLYTLTGHRTGNGYVTVDPVKDLYDQDELVTLTAHPDPGWEFSGWTGDLVSTDNPATITMDSDKDITANFVEMPGLYTLAGHLNGEGYVTLDPVKTLYYQDEPVAITAYPDTGWEFSGWTGDLVSTDNPATITMDSNKDITANFVEIPGLYTLTGHHTGNGYVTVDPQKDIYDEGETVTLTAHPDPGWEFSGWIGDLVSTDNPATITMDSDKDITANFVEMPGLYTLTGHHTGNGYVTVDPVKTLYYQGEPVTITAYPDTGWVFIDWTGDLVSTDNPEVLIMDSNKDITVNFAELDTFTLTYTAGTGGTITGDSPQTVTTGEDGTEVVAVPNTGYHFVDWSDGVDTAARTDTNITADLTVTANFAIDTFTLTYTAGTGGTITGDSPQTVDYGENGTEVVAVPNTGYHFVDWSDGVDTAARTDTNITADLTVTANFAIDTFTLTYTAGTGGTITGDSPQTVDYGEDGTEVVAVPNTGYHFVDWSDGVDTAARTDTNITADLTVTANFAIDTFTLTYTAGTGGTITGDSPQTVDYGEDGTEVVAVPNTGYHFVDWSDGVDTAARTDTNITADLTVTANFAIDTFTLTYTAGTGGTITGDSPQTVDYGEDGTEVVAVPNTGYHFVDWSDGVDTAARTDTNITADLTVTANFAIDTFTLTYTAGTGGTITGDSPQTVDYGEDGTEVVAVPNTGYHFVDWSDGVDTAARTDTNITADLTVTANFAIDTFTLTYTAGTGGTITGDSPQTVDYGEDGTEVVAVPNTGYHFVDWSDGVDTAARTDTNVTADLTVTANFAIDTFTLTYTAGTGGTITGDSPQTVDYGEDGTEVVAVPNAGYYFVDWSDGVDTAARTDTNVTADLTVTANFSEKPLIYSLNTTVVGEGIVTPDPNKQLYYEGEIVALTADPDPTWRFDSWSGDLTGSTNPGTIVMDSNKAVTATFVLVRPPTVTVVDTLAQTADGVLTEGEVTDLAITQFTVTFSEAVKDPAGDTDPDDVTNPANYQLVELGADEGLGGGDDTLLTIDAVSYAEDSFTATLEVNGSVALPIGNYALIAKGTTSIVDLEGNPLDGNGDGIEGDDFVLTFTVDIPPAKPVLETPEHQAIFNDPTPELAWNVSVNALTYDVQIDNNSDFSSPVEDMTGVTNLTYITGELADGRYFWRVRGVNQLDTAGEWSDVWYFTVDTTPPRSSRAGQSG